MKQEGLRSSVPGTTGCANPNQVFTRASNKFTYNLASRHLTPEVVFLGNYHRVMVLEVCEEITTK